MEQSHIDKQFSLLFDNINDFKKQITEIQTHVKKIQKQVKKENKEFNKQLDKYKQRKPKKPSGFAKPSKISKHLCDFMNVPEGTETARTDVTRYVIKYIKDNNLQDEDNKKKIIPDEILHNLLENKSDEEVTYFNLQKFMNKHFVK